MSTIPNLDQVMVIERFSLDCRRDWFWFWFYYALWLASVFTLVLVLRQSSENRSMTCHSFYSIEKHLKWLSLFFHAGSAERLKLHSRNCWMVDLFFQTIVIFFSFFDFNGFWLENDVTRLTV